MFGKIQMTFIKRVSHFSHSTFMDSNPIRFGIQICAGIGTLIPFVVYYSRYVQDLQDDDEDLKWIFKNDYVFYALCTGVSYTATNKLIPTIISTVLIIYLFRLKKFKIPTISEIIVNYENIENTNVNETLKILQGRYSDLNIITYNDPESDTYKKKMSVRGLHLLYNKFNNRIKSYHIER